MHNNGQKSPSNHLKNEEMSFSKESSNKANEISRNKPKEIELNEYDIGRIKKKILDRKLNNTSTENNSAVNKTEVYENKFENLNVSSSVDHRNMNDVSAQEFILNKLVFEKDKDKSKNKNIYKEDWRSAISSEIDPQSSSQRGKSQIVKRRDAQLFPTYTAKSRKNKFIIKRNSVRGDKSKPPISQAALKNYKISQGLSGILEDQMQALLISKEHGNKNQLLLNLNKEKGRNFYPYKNVAEKLKIQRMSRSQRSRKIPWSDSKNRSGSKISRSDQVSWKSDYSRSNRSPTPRYTGVGVRLVKAGNNVVNSLKKSNQYHQRSRQVRTSGVRSNIRSRSNNEPSLVPQSNVCNYTQDNIPKDNLNDNSFWMTKKSGIISLSANNKLKARNDLKRAGKPSTSSKYKHRMKLNKQPKRALDESFEIYSKVNKGKLKFPKGKRGSQRLKSKMCPITIIQAPITVNGDSAINVHQSIVLGSSKTKKKADPQSFGSHKFSIDSNKMKNYNLNSGKDYKISIKNQNKNTNPYSRKFIVKSKKHSRLNSQNSNYTNMKQTNISKVRKSGGYDVTSTFDKRRSSEIIPQRKK